MTPLLDGKFCQYMILQIQKKTITLFLVAIFLAFFVNLPALLEATIKKDIDLNNWKTSFIQKLEKDEIFNVGIQGVYIDLFQGIVLKGLHLQNENKNYRFYSEDFVLGMSFLSLVSKKNEISYILAENANLELVNYSPTTINNVQDILRYITSKLKTSSKDKILPVELKNLSVFFLKKQNTSIKNSFAIDASFRLQNNNFLDKHLVFRSVDNKNNVGENWSLRYKKLKISKAQLELENISFSTLSLLLAYLGWEETLPLFKKSIHIQKAYFTGKGSLDNEENLNLSLAYKDAQAQYIYTLGSTFALPISHGDLSIQRNKEKDTFQIQVKEKDWSLSFQKKEASNSRYNLQIYTSKNSEKGNLQANLTFNKVHNAIEVYGNVKANNLFVPFYKESSQNLYIDTLSFYKKDANQNFQIDVNGKLLEAKLNASLKGKKLRFISMANQEYKLETKADLDIDIDGLSLASITELSRNSYEYFQENVKKLHLRKNIGGGKYRFLKTAVYKNILSGLGLNVSLHLRNFKSKEPFPKELSFLARTNRSRFHLEYIPNSKDLKNNPNFQAQFRYSFIFAENLPHHSVNLKLHLEDNKNSIPMLSSFHSPPQSLNLEYRYNGFGVSIASLLRSSYSYLKLDANKVLLTEKQVLKSIAYSRKEKEVAKEIALDKISFRKSTSGIAVKLYFSGTSSKFNLFGTGNYDMGLGGKASYLVRTQIPSMENSSETKLRILASGEWIPEL